MRRRPIDEVRTVRAAGGVIWIGLLVIALPTVAGLLAVLWSWPLFAALLVGVGSSILLLVLVLPALLIPARAPISLRDILAKQRFELEDDRLKLQNDVRATLVQAVGGLALLGGLYFTWQQLQTTQEQLNAQLRLSHRGQVAERFTRAINQLGTKQLDVRLGGIYGLEQIAEEEAASRDDSQANRVRLVVFDVLAAYVREHSPSSPLSTMPPNRSSGRVGLHARAPDVQAVMTVLARRSVRISPPDPPLDLSAVDLRGASLRDGRLDRVDLGHTRLDAADLHGAHLSSAILDRADLTEADLRNTDLRGGQLTNARLPGARLSGSLLQAANLRGAELQGAELCDANLEGADLGGANLVGAAASERTRWPQGLDWRARGVQLDCNGQ